MISLPIPQSYWVKPGQLLAGEYPGSSDQLLAERRIGAFLRAGINTFINLTQPHELVPYDSIVKEQAEVLNIDAVCHRISIRDHGVPSVPTMNVILDTIDNAISQNRPVYVHCWGGVGRTGTTVGCFLIRHGMSPEQALDQLKEWWLSTAGRVYYPRSPETEEQVEFVRNWREIPPPEHKSAQNFCEG